MHRRLDCTMRFRHAIALDGGDPSVPGVVLPCHHAANRIEADYSGSAVLITSLVTSNLYLTYLSLFLTRRTISKLDNACRKGYSLLQLIVDIIRLQVEERLSETRSWALSIQPSNADCIQMRSYVNKFSQPRQDRTKGGIRIRYSRARVITDNKQKSLTQITS